MFFEFGLKDIIDILLVALMLYYIYRLMRESRSLNVFVGILIFIIVWLFVSQILEMRLLGTILAHRALPGRHPQISIQPGCSPTHANLPPLLHVKAHQRA